jgi:hypothetical protein
MAGQGAAATKPIKFKRELGGHYIGCDVSISPPAGGEDLDFVDDECTKNLTPGEYSVDWTLEGDNTATIKITVTDNNTPLCVTSGEVSDGTDENGGGGFTVAAASQEA